MSISDPRPVSPWHSGEIAIQTQFGVAERMAELGPRVIRDRIVAQHRDFFRSLSSVVLGAVDSGGDVWATLRAGAPGFLDAPDPHHLRVASATDLRDPAEAGLRDGAAIGLLGIDFATRRRNRLNGTILREGTDGFAVRVEQSFGNCPQYIRVRPNPYRAPDAVAAAPEILQRFDARAHAIVAEADTFFVATYVDDEAGHRQVDVSHRGGPPGFVRIEAGGVLTIPDFSGNRFFNTLGNMLANPRAGLAFVDFRTGDLMQMTGRAEISLDDPAIGSMPGAERLWRFTPRILIRRAAAWPLRFDSENAPATARFR